MKKQMQKGFSLVELMVVIAIIAILAAVAIPMYSNYTTRARVSSEIAKVGGTKADVAEALNSGDTVTVATYSKDANVAYASNGDISLSLDANGAATAAANTGPNYIKLSPTKGSGSITWTCTGSGFTQSQMPSTCGIASGSAAVTQVA